LRRYGFATGGAIRLGFAGLGVTLLFAVLLVGASPARAGTWIQVSCVNPDGSAAPNQGWSGFAQGSPGAWSSNNSDCAPGQPMGATLSSDTAVPVDSDEYLEYEPPASSSLVGGTLDVNLVADGYGTDAASPPNVNAVAVAALYEPNLVASPSNLFYQCVAWLAPCPGGGGRLDYSGQITLPGNRGGKLYLQAECAEGNPGASCNTHAYENAWALAQVVWAHLLLLSNVSPQGTQFSGSALQKNARGIAHVVFTASDPGGPGVYSVTVSIDGRPVWSGTPNTNGGACVSVGSDSGSLMFDSSQPCLTTEVVDAPVPTGGLPDGRHELAVNVSDAAQNTSTVLDQTITTSNPQTTPVPRSARAVHARFVISWSWAGNNTTLRSIRVEKLTKRANVSVRCLGRGCPRLRIKSASAHRVGKLLSRLGGKRFRTGDKLRLTVTARGRTAERIELRIRTNRLPSARLLKH
jgi:hypothetical protein